MMRRFALLALLFAFVLPTTGSASERSPRPGLPLLTYVASNGGICLIRADGSHAVRLMPRSGQQVGAPSWSPRGRYVAFERATGSEQSKIFIADARGRVRWRVGKSASNTRPQWSPDGRRIAYFGYGGYGGGYSVARPDGSQERGIAGCTGFPVASCPGQPTWSADSQRLAFGDNDANGLVSIFSVRADGSDRRLLIPHAVHPAYAPTGSKLAYWGPNDPAGELWSLFVADGDGRNPRAITPPARNAVGTPAWSPDGRSLAFVRKPCPNPERCSLEGDLVVASADGSGEHVVASHVVWEAPLWSPRGKLLTFMRGRSIVVARADGGGEQVVVRQVGVWTGRGVFSHPAWRSPDSALPAAKRPPCPRR